METENRTSDKHGHRNFWVFFCQSQRILRDTLKRELPLRGLGAGPDSQQVHEMEPELMTIALSRCKQQ